jgi:hypothetical protein
MANLLAGVLLVTPTVAQQSASPAQTAKTVRVRKDTVLKFAMMRSLDSATAKAGEDVTLRLVRPLVVEGVTLLPAGEVVHSKITRVKRADQRCHDGDIQLKLEPLSFPDSSSANIKVWLVNPNPDAEVSEKYVSTERIGDDILTVILEAPFLVPLLPLMLIPDGCNKAGKEYQLPENATVAVLITQDHKVRY